MSHVPIFLLGLLKPVGFMLGLERPRGKHIYRASATLSDWGERGAPSLQTLLHDTQEKGGQGAHLRTIEFFLR